MGALGKFRSRAKSLSVEKTAELYGMIERGEENGLLRPDYEGARFYVQHEVVWEKNSLEWKKNASLRFARYMDIKAALLGKKSNPIITIYSEDPVHPKILAIVNIEKEKVDLLE